MTQLPKSLDPTSPPAFVPDCVPHEAPEAQCLDLTLFPLKIYIDLILSRVGPAGWSYKDWIGIVYPRRKPPHFHEKRLPSRTTLAPSNSTSRSTVPPCTHGGRVEKVSQNAEFLFTAKLWQEFTHTHDLNADNEKTFRSAMETLRDAGKLGALIAEFPWSLTKSSVGFAIFRW